MELPQSMRAMVLEEQRALLVAKVLPVPSPAEKQVLVRIIACGVCRTDLHIVDGELERPQLPLIPGHEIIGTVVKKGTRVVGLNTGDLVGIPWLGYTCGQCKYCRRGMENLCQNALFTGYTIDGGYAEFTVADEHFCLSLPPGYANPGASPLLCAGLIGYRSYKMIGEDAMHVGIYGFGAAAHIISQLAIYQGRKIYAFTRPGDLEAQSFALSLGAVWSGDSGQSPGVKLDAAIIFAPVGDLIPQALRNLDKGGIIVCGGIHMSDIPSFPYKLLWEERIIRSVANLTREDGEEFLKIAPRVPVKTDTEIFSLVNANDALEKMRQGKIHGAAVLVMDR